MRRLAPIGVAVLALAGCGENGEKKAVTTTAGSAVPSTAAPALGDLTPQVTADDPASLAYAWYAEVDPDVCNHMTDAMLDLGRMHKSIR